MTRAVSKARLYEQVGYVPHEKQRLFHASPARFKVAVCGRRFGKTVMAARDIEAELLIPKKRLWIVGPTYDLAEREFRVVYDDLIITLGLGQEKGVKKSFNLRTGDMYIEFPWQSRLEVRTAAYGPEKSLIGEGLDGVIMSEAAKHKSETWHKYVRPALSDKQGWAVFSTTPEGYDWVYDVWKMGRDPLFPDYESWCFPSWDNTCVYPGGREDPEIKLLEQTMDPGDFDQEIAASFTASSGRIYRDFDESTHVIDYVYNPAWPTYVGMDWGFSHPFAAIEFQVSPSDEIFVFREYYKTYTVLESIFQELKNREHPPGYHLDMGFGDAEDPEATMRACQFYIPTISLPEAKKNWRQGVDLLKRFMQPQQVGEDEFGRPVKRPHFFVDRSCTTLIRELNNYRRKTTKTDPKETSAAGAVNKIDDHGVDSLRYAVMHLFELGAAEHLTDFAAYNPLLQPATASGQDFEQRDSGLFTMSTRW